MKRIVLICSIFLAACSSNPPIQSIAQEKTIPTPFTDTVKLDTFKVSLQGTTSKNSTLLFKIISYKGVEIYSATISGADLLKDNEKLKTETDKIKFLKNEVQYFFEEEHFLWPAVMPNEQADKNVPDKAFHNELKNTKLNGFNYGVGKETKLYIAWSEKEQKVKVYYKCC